MKKLILIPAILFCFTCKAQQDTNMAIMNTPVVLNTDMVIADTSSILTVDELISTAAQYSEGGSKLIILGVSVLVVGAIISAPSVVIGAGIIIIIGEIYHIKGARRMYKLNNLITKKNGKKN